MSINALNPGQLTNICWHLQDRDAKALGITSHKMKEVVQGELKRRDDRLEELLSSYKVIKKFNVQSLKELKLFCLGEIHYQPQLHAEQLELIQFLASRGPCVVLHEGEEAMKVLKEEDIDQWIEIRSWQLLPRDNVYFVGWDDYTELNKLEEENYQQFYDKIEQIDLQYRSVVAEKTTEILKKTATLFPEAKLRPEHIEKYSLRACKKAASVTDVTGVFVFAKEKIKEMVYDHGYQLPITAIKDLVNVINASAETVKQARLIVPVYVDQAQREKIINQILAGRNTFPIRTKSMGDTVKNIDLILAQLGLRWATFVLIAGRKHLKMNEKGIDSPGSLHDLTYFYEQLKHHKAAILFSDQMLALDKKMIGSIDPL